MSKCKRWKPYSCPICKNALFSSLFSLNRHKTWRYNSTKNHSAGVLGRNDNNNSILFKALNDLGVDEESGNNQHGDDNNNNSIDYNDNDDHNNEFLSSIMAVESNDSMTADNNIHNLSSI